MKTMIPLVAPETEATTDSDSTHEPSPAPQQTIRSRAAVVRRIIVILFLVAVAATHASAQSTVSITASPIELSEGIVKLCGELKIIDAVSIAGTAGIGTHAGERVTVGGGQIRVYLTGGFDGGMHVGAEALYTEMKNASSAEGLMNLMSGASGGPFVGYKHVLPFGLTLDVQGGIRFSEGRIATGAEGGRSASETKLGPIANVNVGWSF